MPYDFCPNHLEVLHLLMVAELECMLSTAALNDFNWVVGWVLPPKCVTEPSFHTHMQDFTDKNANWYHIAGKVTVNAEREINFIKQLAREK